MFCFLQCRNCKIKIDAVSRPVENSQKIGPGFPQIHCIVIQPHCLVEQLGSLSQSPPINGQLQLEAGDQGRAEV
jgi:hypothetical protein